MSVDVDIDALSKLAMLDLDENEKSALKDSLHHILDHFNKLQNVETQGVSPLYNINEEVSVIRKDEVERKITKEEVLASAPQESDGCYKILRIMGKDS